MCLLVAGTFLLWVGMVASPAFATTPPRSAARGNFQSLANRAASARDADRLDEAASLYKRALALRPKWAEGWWSLGTILYDKNSYGDAARAFTRLLALDPKNGTAHLMLALCQYQFGMDNSALDHIQAAKDFGIQKDEQLHHVMQYHEAMLLLRMGRYESAAEVLRYLYRDEVGGEDLTLALAMSALLMRPSSLPPPGSAERVIVIRVGQAERFSLGKQFAEAKQAYTTLVTENPAFPNLHYAFGRHLMIGHDPQEAIIQFEAELQNNPKHIRARLQIAAAHYRSDSAAGLPYAEEAVKMEPRFPFGHYLLGLLYLDTGDAARAVSQLEIPVRMIPNEPEFYFALGNAYAKAGRKQDAAKARATFVELNAKAKPPSGPPVYGEQPTGLDQQNLGGTSPPPQ
jgi:predicted Zn-dependent protease